MLRLRGTPHARCDQPSSAVCNAHPLGNGCSTSASSSTGSSRRALLLGTVLAPLSFGAARRAEAASPVDLSDYFSRAFPPAPEPVFFPRKQLTQAFAVLLMRSAYETVDDLDFIAMNDFQKQFWKLRASEQEAYNMQYEPLKPKIGDVTDSLYFDFISYSQFSTIAREMPKGQQVFKEYCEEGCPDMSRVVRRDATLADNNLLPAVFFTKTGDRIYSGLKDGFRDVQFGAPQPLAPGASLPQLASTVQTLLNICVTNGYALKAEVSEVDEAERSFKVRITGPANLWGLTSLNHRRAQVVNCYDAMLIDSFLRASGRTGTFDLTTTTSGIEETWVLTA